MYGPSLFWGGWNEIHILGHIWEAIDHTYKRQLLIGQHMPECRLFRTACAGWIDILLHEGLPFMYKNVIDPTCTQAFDTQLLCGQGNPSIITSLPVTQRVQEFLIIRGVLRDLKSKQ